MANLANFPANSHSTSALAIFLSPPAPNIIRETCLSVDCSMLGKNDNGEDICFGTLAGRLHSPESPICNDFKDKKYLAHVKS